MSFVSNPQIDLAFEYVRNTGKLNSEFLAKLKRIDLITDDKAVLKRARQYLQNVEKEVLIKHACFVSCKSGFSAPGCIRAKTTAELDSRESKDVRSTADVPMDTPHPDLYRGLLEWRDVMAEELDIALHEVLPTRAISPCLALFQNAKRSLTSIASLRAQPNQKCLRRFVASENMPGMIQEY